MDDIQLTQEKTNVWYLVTWCNNHMTSNKNSFIKLGESVKRSIRFADNSMVTLEGIRNILMKKNDKYIPRGIENTLFICEGSFKHFNLLPFYFFTTYLRDMLSSSKGEKCESMCMHVQLSTTVR